MSNLANNIESYIKRLLDASPNAAIFMQRRELAERFQCVPSQINYVLSTRFTPERGYLVESRRGGGGYLRIRRLDLNRERVIQLLDMLRGIVDEGITCQGAADCIDRLSDARIITRREASLMRAATTAACFQEPFFHPVRANILARMLEVLLKES